jgi:hypothetical protein
MRCLCWLIVIVLLLSACAPVPPARLEGDLPTPSAVPHNPGVADLLRNPPAPGETVEVDAYFSGAGALVFPGGPPPPSDQVFCPTFFSWSSALTGRPFTAALLLLNGVQSNTLLDDAPWLVATTPEATRPGVRVVPQLPYHARLRGHLGDPAFAHCPHADRIFVVEDVVTVYAEQPPDPSAYQMELPDDYADWPRYHDAELGYSLPYPHDWQVERPSEPGVVSAIALRALQWPGYPVVVRVHAGETRYDQYDPVSAPPLLHGEGFGVFEQGWTFGEEGMESQHLAGYRVDREADAGERAVSVLFSAHGRTYELALRYPLGFDAPQPLLMAYSAIVEGFRLDVIPGSSPTPPVKQTLGAGPFLSQDEALACVREREEQEIELLDAQLVSEAEARRRADACGTFFGHPEGVWVLTVHGTFEGAIRTMLLFLDATDGEQLCGEEINPEATPYPTLPPGTTATPVPTVPPETPTPSLSLSQLPAAPPSDCPHTPLGGFYDVWRNEQVWPRLGCAIEAAIPINGTEAYLCCNVHSIWIREKRLFVALDGSHFRWAFVADGSGLPAEAIFVTPTWQPPTSTPGPPPPTPVPTPTQVPPPTPPTATPMPAPSPTPPQPTATPAGAQTPLPTVVLMTRLSWPLSEPCFRASGRHGWLANLLPWAERCSGLSASNETLFSGAMEQFEGGWLLWNGNVCFVLFDDGTWTMF